VAEVVINLFYGSVVCSWLAFFTNLKTIENAVLVNLEALENNEETYLCRFKKTKTQKTPTRPTMF